MKKKILAIILFVLIVLLIIFMIIKPKFYSKNNSNKKTSRNFILNSNTSTKVNTKGENSGIYVGITQDENENFIYFSIKIDKKTSKENQVNSLISEISSAIGYKIDINSIKVDDNKVKIDFAKTAAPFELKESYEQTDDQKYFVSSNSVVSKTIFDSIDKTLKSYFGADTEVYFSADNENINIENDIITMNIDKDVSY